jgi:pRiA4b ORF-3-like protein
VDDRGVRFHRLRIALADVEPEIWRRVDVPSHLNLEELHRVIQAAMGWLDYHLHSCEIDGKRYALPDPDGADPECPSLDERDVTLAELVPGTRFRYEYDFGDSWIHEIVVEDTHESDLDLAFCSGGARAGPPDDCGGVGGYENLLGILSDPQHEDYEETLTWLGGPLHSDAFRLQTLNSALVALSREPPGKLRKRISRKRS